MQDFRSILLFFILLNSDLSTLKGSASANETVNLTAGSPRYKVPKDGYWSIFVSTAGTCGGAIFPNSTSSTPIGGIAINSGTASVFVRKGLYISTQVLTSGSISEFTPIDMVAD